MKKITRSQWMIDKIESALSKLKNVMVADSHSKEHLRQAVKTLRSAMLDSRQQVFIDDDIVNELNRLRVENDRLKAKLPAESSSDAEKVLTDRLIELLACNRQLQDENEAMTKVVTAANYIFLLPVNEKVTPSQAKLIDGIRAAIMELDIANGKVVTTA